MTTHDGSMAVQKLDTHPHVCTMASDLRCDVVSRSVQNECSTRTSAELIELVPLIKFWTGQHKLSGSYCRRRG